jgi:hypothetical protein
MMRDKSASERDDYNWQIVAKERTIDELYHEQKYEVQRLEQFEQAMMQSFHELLLCEDEVRRIAGTQHEFSETEEKRRYISRVVANQYEEMVQTYTEARQALEDEREALQRERDELPWD